MGLFDLPSPIFTWLDELLSTFLAPAGRLILWAAFGSAVSMELYRVISPQRRIAQIKQAFERAQGRAASADGTFAETWAESRRMVALALRRVGLAFPATMVAALPLIVVVVWLDGSYGGRFPAPGEPVSVQVPQQFEGYWIPARSGTPPRAMILDGAGTTMVEVAVPSPVPVIHKWRWWNVFIGNPAGYLPSHLPVDWIAFALPRQQVLDVGPDWMRGWEATFFTSVLLLALGLKAIRRIQ